MTSCESEEREAVTSALEKNGIAGARTLRRLLSTAADPIQAITEFQIHNSIQLPTLNPALKLLDLHNVRRHEYHELVLSEVSERLIGKLRQLGEAKDKKSQKQISDQLDKCFPLYKVPQIRPIVLETLAQLPKVPDRYLKVILSDEQFYKNCSMKVRQQIWQKNDKLFVQSVQPLFNSYVCRKEKQLRNIDCGGVATFFVSETTKARRQWKEIQDLMAIVGEREVLYERLLQLIRSDYLRTKSVHYCSLRLELSMAARDLGLESITKLDYCHEFAWTLDTCLRDKHLDGQLTSKLKNLLETTKKTDDQMWMDMSMIAADPHVVHFFSSLVVKLLKDQSNPNSNYSFVLPRDVLQLPLLFRLLYLGTTARPPSPALSVPDSIIFTKFLPDLTTLAFEDFCRSELKSAPDEVVDEQAPDDYLSTPFDSLTSFVKTDTSAAWVYLTYVLEMFASRKRPADRPGLLRYIPLFAKANNKIGYSDQWLHLMVSRLIQGNSIDSLMANEEASCLIWDEYLFKCFDDSKLPGVKYHILRLINFLHVSIGNDRCMDLMEKLRPEALIESEDGDSTATAESDNGKMSRDEYRSSYERVAQKLALGASPVQH